MRLQHHLSALFCAALFLTSCRDKTHPKMPPVAIEATKVVSKEMKIYLDAVGTTDAWKTVSLHPQISGVVLEAHVKEGDVVEEGQLLYTIDPRPYQASRDEAAANLQEAEAQTHYNRQALDRNKKLVTQDFVSKLSIEELENNLALSLAAIEKAKAALELAEVNLGYCFVKSPIAGKISTYNVQPGNLVKGNDTDEVNSLTTIRQMHPLQVQFAIPQRSIPQVIAMRMKGPLQLNAYRPTYPDMLFPGTVFFVDNNVSTETGTLLLKGEIPNIDEALWPGEFVRVKLLIQEEDQAIVVPESAIQKGQSGFFVFVVKEDQTVELRPIERGATAAGEVIVKSGLKEGEVIVTLGQLNLRNGSAVFLAPPKPSNPS